MATGFCGGHPAGRAEIPRGNKVAGCWWPDGKAELLALEGRSGLKAGSASGEVIPGFWSDAKRGTMGAVAWTLRQGKLTGAELHEDAYTKTWAVASGGGAVVGMGMPAGKPGKVGLVWRDGASIAVPGAGEVSLLATAGARVAGSIQGRPSLWWTATDSPLDLTPEGITTGEVQALDGELQAGIVWKGWCPRAAIWRGSPGSFIDLTPQGFEAASAYGAGHGFQVGFVRASDTTRDGSPGCDNRAVLWQGSADTWIDLNALLPAQTYNASIAWAIDVRGDVLQACGVANRYEVSHRGTPQESHAVPVEHPVVWTARLSSEASRVTMA